jgi:hypothetical protein
VRVCVGVTGLGEDHIYGRSCGSIDMHSIVE